MKEKGGGGVELNTNSTVISDETVDIQLRCLGENLCTGCVYFLMRTKSYDINVVFVSFRLILGNCSRH